MTQAASPSAARNHFPGLPRFELRRQLGEGSFGTVYEALDHDSSCIVALKHLRLVTADTLYLFNRKISSWYLMCKSLKNSMRRLLLSIGVINISR